VELFDEKIFIRSLTLRPEDARHFAVKFRAEWLHSAAYQPIFAEIQAFIKEFKKSPSLQALHLRFESKDKTIYQVRIKPVLDELATVYVDATTQMEVLKQAGDVAVVRSFQELSADQSFQSLQADFDGKQVLQTLQKWIYMHLGLREDKTMNIDEAVQDLFVNSSLVNASHLIPCGIKAIDDWCLGGMLPGNLGLIAAPTGGGKSVALILMSYKMASIEDVPVWYVTNEITSNEATKRYLSRITRTSISDIIRDPLVSHKTWDNEYRGTFADKLRISEVSAEMSTEQLEAEMLRTSALYGWMPKVICLDYMGRMKPNEAGYDRAQEWVWLGGVATDLVHLAKKYNMLIWSAIQTNRSGLNSKEITIEQMQGSIRHLQEASTIVALKQTMVQATAEEGEEIGMTIYNLKMRHGKRGKPVTVKINLDKMDISNVEAEVVNRKEKLKDDDEKAGVRPNKKKDDQ